MSVRSIPIYRTEAGVQQSPAVTANYDTHCVDGDGVRTPKKFREVLLKFVAGAWVEQAVYSAGSIAGTRVDNPCTGDFALLAIPANDFNAFQQCCGKDCPSNPMPNTVTLPQGQVGVPYNQTRQLFGAPPFAVASVNKPAWMTIAVNATTGLVTFSGTPTVAGNNITVSFYAANCGNAASAPNGTLVTINPLVIIAA